MSQRDETSGRLRLINFFSFALSSSQRNYSAGQLEAWALVAATRKWELYLKSAPELILVTDHNHLQRLRKQRDPRHTFARWLLELEEIPYQIRYRPGTQNQLPDYLSRKTGLGTDQNSMSHLSGLPKGQAIQKTERTSRVSRLWLHTARGGHRDGRRDIAAG